jgi:hypothetical protein
MKNCCSRRIGNQVVADAAHDADQFPELVGLCLPRPYPISVASLAGLREDELGLALDRLVEQNGAGISDEPASALRR